jgi:hypothetical protein
MTPTSTTTELPQPRTTQTRLSRWTRQRRLHSDLTRRDRAAAQLAELHQIRTFIAAAHALIGRGWVQNGWFAHRTERNQLQATSGWDAYRNNGQRVAGACLVGAITHAVRVAHLRDLIRWNDDPHRTAAEVAALLRAVEQAAGSEIERVRRQLSGSATSPGPSRAP